MNKRVYGLTVVLLILASASVSIHAQATWVYRGQFTLPFSVQWDQVKLPAGQYSFLIDHAAVESRLLLRQGTRSIGIIMPKEYSSYERSNHGQRAVLLLANHSVRALYLPGLGSFYYSGAGKQTTQTAALSEPTQEIPVLMGGN